MQFNKFFIHASNVHQGGGRTLLDSLLKAVKGEVVLCVDERMPLPTIMTNIKQVRRVKPHIFQRLMTETWLSKVVDKKDIVLCFGNLPPLFKLRGYVVVFVQNRYLVEDVSLNDFSLKTRIRLALERLWLSGRLMNADEFIVQTSTMKRLLELKTRGKVPVRVLPFVSKPIGYERNLSQLSEIKDAFFDFTYVASGESHKNHECLIKAWYMLKEEGLFPSLCLTLNAVRFPKLCDLIFVMQQRHGIKITNLGDIPHDDVLVLYKKSAAVIYPSKFESLGLPLIEARNAGLPVLASELDYVRDVLDPEQVFDPDSPTSIARAVKRYMHVNEMPLPILDVTQFLSSLLKGDLQ